MEPVLREACDHCHRRKMRCPSDLAGACLNCRNSGQICSYSPRNDMGRPRRDGARKPSRVSKSTVKRSRASSTGNNTNNRKDDISDLASEQTASLSFTCGGLNELSFAGSQGEPPSRMESGHESYLVDTVSSTSHSSDVLQTPFSQLPPYQLSPSFKEHPHCIQDFGFDIDSYINSLQVTPLSCHSCLSKTSMTDWIGVNTELSKILFTLRGQQEVLSLSANDGQIDLDEIFQLVSTLCDIVNVLLENHRNGSSPLETSGDISPPFMLAMSTISTVLEIYKSAIDAYWTLVFPPVGNQSLSGSESPEVVLLISSYQQSSTHQRLKRLSQFTSMDLHLAELQRVFNHIDPAINNNQVFTAYTERGRTLAQELRNSLQILIGESTGTP